MGTLVPVSAAAPFVSLGDAKRHLRIDSPDDDELLKGLIAVACASIDGPNGMLGRALASQQWKMVLPCFPDCVRILPQARSIQSVKYLDSQSSEQTLDAGLYKLTASGFLRFIGSLPSIASDPDAVTIAFTSGYEDAADIPRPIWAAALLLITHLYENRSAVEVGTLPPAEFPFGVTSLLSPYRVW